MDISTCPPRQRRLRSAFNKTGSYKGNLMAISLYDLSVPTFLQTVSAIGGFLERTATYCAETGADPDDFVNARLFDDMSPFHFQIECVAHHSVWALEAVKTGVFAPPALVGSVLGDSPSRRRLFSSRSHYQTSISTLLPPTTSCGREVCRLESVILRASYVLSRPRSTGLRYR